MDLATCAPNVSPELMRQIVRVESGGNPYAIGVVGARLERQPKTLPEAVATVKSLKSNGYNFSIGIGQINKVHFQRLGWEAAETGFDICTNLKASAGVLNDCHSKALKAGYPQNGNKGVYTATHAALSCYYSGNLIRGAQLGYVSKVVGEVSVPGRQVKSIRPLAVSMLIE